ncbi:hypothetical protein CIPAW_03G197200 [Carya illinoinensis]|uniref:Uncharacterized protein n=1 Tax=Carya illinoinensis TaxID=32201 RepID=A0A8T1R6I4_CARIL|nr:hypothetical protein CIPAW_03G197200 [Carya illinoinensis]
MKAFYIVSFLLTSVIFVPSSIIARELSQSEENSALGHKLMELTQVTVGCCVRFRKPKPRECPPSPPPCGAPP